MDENGGINADATQTLSNSSGIPDDSTNVQSLQPNASQVGPGSSPASNPFMNGEIRTLDGEIAGDEFTADAINYQVLLNKIDTLLEKLKLDA
jgi:ankyrin repeat/BTB/POZ domain-containing protein 1